jgi:hypothetical protein
LWKSDPAQQLEQWLELEWNEAQRVGTVELTFPGHLIREYHAYAPFYRDPQCAKRYRLEAWEDGGWVTVSRAGDNYQRRRVHRLEQPVVTRKLRVVIEATNGDPAAAVYEIRCYEE